ncbi:hypothetical protein [Shewanella aestuarii]|uniref:Uncharacterized protein n=1 Tax=Shewanella aestuarii TaxID=1028752 RepID=A0A6G9QFX1_9GAMM|nr:hypothetical protein [Shewanella aestuarii]QIR13420.1 hypothetical protein HBH39_02015 [Shewanella aestuarii]
MRTSLTLAASLVTLLLVQGCNEQAPVSEPAPAVKPAVQAPKVEAAKPEVSPQQESTMLQGTVRYMSFEGGFWGIEADNGQQILPTNLAAEYKKDGLRISFKASPETDMMSIQQWGTLSNLSDIEVIGQVESKGDPRI